MSTVADPADELGYDVFVDDDLDPSGRSSSGLELYGSAVLHRITCEQVYQIESPGGGLVDFGVDVRKWAREAVTPDSLAAKSPLVEEAIRRDERTASVEVSLSLADGVTFADGARVSYTIAIHAVAVSGVVLDRVVGVSAVTVDFLAQGR